MDVRSLETLDAEIEFARSQKNKIVNEVTHFVLKANIALEPLGVSVVRSTDKSYTHLVYRKSGGNRSRISSFQTLMVHLESLDDPSLIDYKTVVAIEAQRIQINDYWARLEYGKDRTTLYKEQLTLLNSHHPVLLKQYLEAPYPILSEELLT